MLIITMIKGVPARTTGVITVSGVLRREEMDLVMNPHDSKALQAAHYVRQAIGGKIVAVSMGPEPKIVPIMQDLYEPNQESKYVPRMPIYGVDENIVLSDRRMAGADTLATAYALSAGIKKIIDIHAEAVNSLINLVKSDASATEIEKKAEELYRENLIPNKIYSTLPTIKDSAVKLFVEGSISREELLNKLEEALNDVYNFIILAGMKTSDGETGNTGPQTAEGLGELLGKLIPHVAFVRDFEIFPDERIIVASRRVGNLVQKLRIPLPCLLTIHTEYTPRIPPAGYQKKAKRNGYRGQVRKVKVWDADYIGADPSRLGFAGSPTIVGPGMEIGKPPVQKIVGESLVFEQDVEEFEWRGSKYGPFKKGDLVQNLPEELVKDLREKNIVGVFTLKHLLDELFGGVRLVARAV